MNTEETPQGSNADTSSEQTIAQRMAARKQELDKGTELTLPDSGLVVLVKRPNVKKMVASGKIPDSLASAIVNGQSGNMKLSAADLVKLVEVQQFMITECLIKPKVVVENPDLANEEITLDMMEDLDQNYIYAWIQGGVKALESFRNDS